MWVDGYWTGKMIDGYPASYFDSGRFEFPWEKAGANIDSKSVTPAKPTQDESDNHKAKGTELTEK